MKEFDSVCVIIPSLDPDEKLKGVVDGLIEEGFSKIILVDDGSRAENKKYFPDNAECTRLTHEVNRGKGRALKTAFSYVLENAQAMGVTGVITVDGDGQHKPSDIAACARRMLAENTIVLGVRDFSLDGVPKRSRFGNNTTSLVFRLVFGIRLSDTQTGLRAIPCQHLATLAEAEGERFEYETNMLLLMKRSGISFVEEKIETVYIEENKTSHFKPVKDSLRIYGILIKFILSSCASALIDVLAYWILHRLLSGSLLGSTVLVCTAIARIISSVANMLLNKNGVFKNSVGIGRTVIRYYALAVPIMLASALAVKGLTLLFGVSASSSTLSTLIKIPVDTLLFFISFRIQHNWVFSDKK